ncbi:MAG: MFS transporter [Pelagibacteraceae bacterium]|jgi:PAT family beta-lactamase induction signal transducer AmpG|nr:MFS transporter [Pelagibacteraceae bacterium]|tara:strand:- start:186 stop:1964 length:1779 start_codon:yes stop_codon:yes gene_type:complete
MEIEKKQSWIDSLMVYKDIRMVRILLLGAISGFPWVLIASSLSLWLKEEGLSRSTIGWAGLIFGVYAINFLWAPIIDRIQIPFLTKKLGHRRGWIVLMQIVILLSLVVWSFINPTENFTFIGIYTVSGLYILIAVGLIIAIASATQDITVDALRIEQINENEGKSMAAGAAMAVVGWWTGYKLGGVIALFTAEYFENMGIEDYWQTTFLVLGVVIILMNIGLMFVHETLSNKRQENQRISDQIIEKDLGSAKRNYLRILGGILLIFSILELLPEFSKTKNLFPFLPLNIMHYIIISILVGGLSYFFIKRNALIFTSVFIVFVFFFKILLSFVIVSLILGILGIALLNAERDWGQRTASWISGRIGGPLVTFFKNNGLSIAIGILAFVFLFKVGEAFLGRMSIVFYKEIGFSKSEIAIFSKGVGWITTVVFTLLGGIFAMRSGSVKTMFIAGILMAVTNLLFSYLNWYVQAIPLVSYEFDLNFYFWTWHIVTSNHQLVFGAAVALDDIAAAFATVAFVAFISLLVNRTYTATQYALLASIGTAGRTTLASSSGALVDWLNGDWGTFFILTAVMVIPSLICLWFIKDKLKLRAK